jgi:hypothetical protein
MILKRLDDFLGKWSVIFIAVPIVVELDEGVRTTLDSRDEISFQGRLRADKRSQISRVNLKRLSGQGDGVRLTRILS